MKVCVLASGSKGNACFIKTASHNILIDLGISCRQLDSRLKQIGEKTEEIDILLITHEHTDHISGLGTFLSKVKPSIYTTSKTMDKIYRKFPDLKDYELFYPVKKDDIVTFNDLEIKCIETFHDASEPLGFVIKEKEKKLVYITDTGYIHSKDYSSISNADCYILESNHDPEVLMMSNRPYDLKRRILSDKGHLSNVDSAICLAYVLGRKTKTIVHAHISEECNCLELVSKTYQEVLESFSFKMYDFEFIFAKQNEITKVIEV